MRSLRQYFFDSDPDSFPRIHEAESFGVIPPWMFVTQDDLSDVPTSSHNDIFRTWETMAETWLHATVYKPDFDPDVERDFGQLKKRFAELFGDFSWKPTSAQRMKWVAEAQGIPMDYPASTPKTSE